MALPINVGELIENRVVESTRIEYKSDWDPEPIVHSITAFANDIDNSGGGYIVVGIAEQNGMPKIPISGLNKGSIDRIQKGVTYELTYTTLFTDKITAQQACPKDQD